MKKFAIAAIAAAGLGMALAPLASADSDSFLTVLANDGWHGSSAAAIAVGQHICSDIAAGVPQATTMQTISDNTTDGVEPKDAAFFYSAAATNLCGH